MEPAALGCRYMTDLLELMRLLFAAWGPGGGAAGPRARAAALAGGLPPPPSPRLLAEALAALAAKPGSEGTLGEWQSVKWWSGRVAP